MDKCIQSEFNSRSPHLHAGMLELVYKSGLEPDAENAWEFESLSLPAS